MQIEELVITNFRGIENYRFYFEGNKPVVLIGNNGSGKSSTLDCVAILLSQFIYRVSTPSSTGRRLEQHDIKINESHTANAITVKIAEERYSWSIEKFRVAKFRPRQNNSELRVAIEKVHTALEGNADANLPLAVYYPTNRSVLDIPLRIRTKHTFRQTDAYDNALTGGGIAFRRFFEWFREREDLENEQRLDDSAYRDSQLTAIRNAVTGMRPEYTALRVRRNPLRMIVTKNKQELEIGMLSDGEKCLLALTGDLARRLAIANPGRQNALQGEAIVLIDEVELHLHPKWQREVIPSLVKTFSGCQFILTTHSPQVISDVQPKNVFILEGNTIRHPEGTLGRDSNRILEDVMGATERPLQIQEDLANLFRLIDDGNLTAAKSCMKKLAAKIGYSEPLFAKAEVMIGRQRALAK